MPSKKIIPSSYQHLFTTIKSTLTHGLLAAEKALEYERLKTYWQIGRAINAAVKSSKGRLKLSETLYQTISRDLNRELGLDLSADLIGRTVQFHKRFPRVPGRTPLTFTHYLALMRIDDKKKRAQLEKAAIRQKWTVLELRSEAARINGLAFPASAKKGRLKIERGEPYVYRVRPQAGLDGREYFTVDCGFKIAADMPPEVPFTLDNSRVVRSDKIDGKYTLHLYPDGIDKIYTYAARVTRIVDGDTIDVHIDVGFGIGLNERLRLKGIDAPEANTPGGKLASAYLKKYLSACPLVVIRTRKAEMYGRWLADVFALKGSDDVRAIAARGKYVNQVLLDEGLAGRYGE